MMNRFFILLFLLGFVWYFVETKNANQNNQSHNQPQLNEKPEIKKWNRLPSSIVGDNECTGPCLELTIQSTGQTIRIDSEDDAISINLIKNDQLKLKLVNSKAYDSILTYGSNQADFSDQKLVINWTRIKKSDAVISQDQNQYRYYRTQWKLSDERKFKTAVFSIDTFDLKSPEFTLHYQPYNSGIRELTLSSVEKNGLKVEGESLVPLVLARNSILTYEIRDFSQVMVSCLYLAPNGSEEDCTAWSKSRLIRSISEQDIGLHKLKMNTKSGVFDFEFRVLAIE